MSADVVCLIDELDPAEVFLIRALRNWAIGRRDGHIAAWAEIWNAFEVALGEDRGPDGVRCFERMLAVLNNNARRMILHHAPNCRCVGTDETDFVGLVAALAHDAPGEARHVAMDLVHPAAVEPLLKAGRDLAHILRRCDHVPTLRVVLRPANDGRTCIAARPQSRLLH